MRGLDAVLLFVLLELINQLLKFLRLRLIPLNLILQLLQLALQRLYRIALVTLFFLGQHYVLVKKVTFSHLGFDAFFGLVDISTQILELLVSQSEVSLQGTQDRLELMTLLKERSILLFSFSEKGFLGFELMS